MWPNPQEIADLVTFTEEMLKSFIFCAVFPTVKGTLKSLLRLGLGSSKVVVVTG